MSRLSPEWCWVTRGRRLGLPVNRLELAAEALGRVAHQLRRDHRAAGDRDLDRREVERLLVEAFHHRDQHGRHAQDRRHLLALDQPQDRRRVEQLDEEHRAAGLERAQRNQPAAAGVEHRHEVRPDRVRTRTRPDGAVARIVGERAVRQHRPLGEARRAGGVLNLRRIVRRDFGQLGRPVADTEESRGVVHIDDLAHGPQGVDGGDGDFRHGIAPVAFHREQPGGARLLQHIAQFGGLV